VSQLIVKRTGFIVQRQLEDTVSAEDFSGIGHKED